MDYLSAALARIVTVHAYIPSDTTSEFTEGNPHYEREMKTLYLLHGFSGNSTDWVTGSHAMELSRQYNMAIVMPSGENSFYLNQKGTGKAYETFIAQELLQYMAKNFGLSTAKKDNFIGGLSMGGFGALRLGAKYNHQYGAVFGLSSAMIIQDIAGMTEEACEKLPVKIADYDYYRSVFGDLSTLIQSDKNPEYIIHQKVAQGEKLPPMFMACGTEDALIHQNRAYKAFLESKSLDITYHEGTGGHNWAFWTTYLEPAMVWALDRVMAKEKKSPIPHGDMPGDKVDINEDHIRNSKIIFAELMKTLPEALGSHPQGKVVLSVCGGSGVGKSETASLLSHYLNERGIGSYTLSGDNYPRRIPMYNDAERLRIFRSSGMKALVQQDALTKEVREIILDLQKKEVDASDEYRAQYPWFKIYLEGAVEGLKTYLGTEHEIDFQELSSIVQAFKAGEKEIWLKRMGRTDSALWYDKVDFQDKKVMIIEWTHGNNDHLLGVDIPILLNSTPEETLAHRRSRNRDGKTDSPFTMKVLEIEQGLLKDQAKKAKIILSKKGTLISYESMEG